MISLTTWWWNWRYRKLIAETKRIIRWRLFLDECGLSRYHVSAKNILRLSKSVL
jgi:hypothetical protein